jgi:hypothetical protein
MDCHICSNIFNALWASNGGFYRAEIGQVNSTLTNINGCLTHMDFIKKSLNDHDKTFRKLYAQPAVSVSDNSLDDRLLAVVSSGRGGDIALEITQNGRKSSILHPKVLVFQDGQVDHPGKARELDQKTIDVKLLKTWKEDCQKMHEGCQNSFGVDEGPQIRPALLIDTKMKCIVSGRSNDYNYVALSYCWGTSKEGKTWFQSQNQFIRNLKEQNAFSPKSKYGKLLPKTIKHAIDLVSEIGERYLWVDSLCIVQDDREMVHNELRHMTGIYAGASFTIVAADGSHADYGLLGFRFSTARKLRQTVIKIGRNQSLVQPISYNYEGEADDGFRKSVYHSRAWTFQEFVYSKRLLIFEEQSVRWECNTASWCEDSIVTETSRKSRPRRVAKLRHPSISEFEVIINMYNKRMLSHAEDALPAFLGIQSYLSPVFPHGFINGMPVLFFDIAMSWTPDGNVKRRTSESKATCPPSWSWLGWTGPIKMCADTEETVSNRPVKTLNLVKTVDWFAIENPRSKERLRINADWYTMKPLSQQADRGLLPGWQRDKIETDKHDYEQQRSQDSRKYHFTHSSASETRFRYQLPVGSQTSGGQDSHNYDFVTCETRSAFFCLGGALSPSQQTGVQLAPWVSVRNFPRNDKWCGALCLQLGNLSDSEESKKMSTAMAPVELVEISEGYTAEGKPPHLRYGMEEWDVEERLRTGTEYHFYNVLWVERDRHNVAHRKAAGRIAKDRWTESNPEPTTLILG